MRILRWLAGALAILVLALVATVVIAGVLHTTRAPEMTATGLPRVQSIYLPMSDGVPIAIDIVLPKDIAKDAKVPVLIKGTPYWRAPQLTFIGGAAAELGLVPDMDEPDVALLNARGYAVLNVDTRGTGASGGHVDILLDERELKDFGEIVDWAAMQSWSNGRVGAYGFSYRGLLATGTASLNRPALKAIAPTFDFADLYLTMRPGGVLADKFVSAWGSFTAALNRGEAPWCNALFCRLMLGGPKRVPSDSDGRIYAAAIAEHAKNWNVYECARKALARDDKVCDSGRSFADISELGHRKEIEQSGIPMLAIVGYFDSNSPQLALARFNTFSNPQTLIIGALSHGGFISTDPFAHSRAPDPDLGAQTEMLAKFFDRYLKADEKPSGKTIRYLVMNGGGWRESDRWPPAGTVVTPWYLGDSRTLTPTRPAATGVDEYQVDFGATSGELSRYSSPVDLSPTSYPHRNEADKKLLTYTSEPLVNTTDIVGSPLATLTFGTNVGDAEVIVYLERIAPDGAVTYLTEGVMRLTHARLNTNATAISADAHHSFTAADSGPWSTSEIAPLVIELNPIAVRLNKGDRIRIAIAGADANNLERIPASGDVKFGIVRGAHEASRIELPQMAVSP